MDEIQELLTGAQASVRAALEAAYAKGFDAGRKQGERDASAGLKAKLAALLETGETAPTKVETEYVAPSDIQQLDDGERAAPGTVKPTIISLLANSRVGMTTKEIVSATGFKHNSVRGTLWTLKNEGAVERNGHGRWVASEVSRTNEAPTGSSEGAPQVTGEVDASPNESRSGENLFS